MAGTGTLIPFWDIKDDTFVTTDQIRLTPDIQSRKGALWNTVVSITERAVLFLQIGIYVLEFKINMPMYANSESS